MKEDKLEMPYEKWPQYLKSEQFDKLQGLDFENMSKEEYKKYESTIRAYRDIKNGLDAAWKEGYVIGIRQTSKR